MNRSNPWLKPVIVLALIAAGFWFLRNWDYGPLNNFRGLWNMPQGGHGGMMGYGGGWGIGTGMGIGMLIFWGLIVYAIVSLISGFFSGKRYSDMPAGQPDDALEILKKRYARGEIDKTEFEAKRRDLNT